ncbi:MAG: glutaminyl-peptide cyclotransferase [Mycobacteriaceae bacterium]|nr:glutaminyl-peptide cyclotransferase [Mycobacteriaceae bacterium]
MATAVGVLLLGVGAAASAAPVVNWTLVAARPHATDAFTEGLVANRGTLLESTGLEGSSSLRRVDPRTGRVLSRVAVPSNAFGEGMTVLLGTIWQVTWRDHRIYGYAPSTLRRRSDRRYPFEGWGLTDDGRSLIASDGSSTLRWIDPKTLTVRRSVDVTDDAQPVRNLNELEMIDGAIWANVWMTDRIAIIDPSNGHVRAWIDLSPLDPLPADREAVLNGITVDPVTRLPLVTGKRWPRMFVIRPEGPIPA